MSDKKITILIPVYDEEESLTLLYDRLTKVIIRLNYKFELLFVNDGSNDNSLEIIKNLAKNDDNVSFLNLSRNFGKEIAMAAGIDYATGDALVILDADLQDPPELIEKMIEEWEKGYDDIYAKRRSRSGETFFKKYTSYVYYKILQKSTRVPIQVDTGDFRLLSKRAIEALKTIKESQRYTKGLFSWIGLNKKEIEFDRDPRIAGETKWNYFKLFELAIEGITSFTIAPLRLASILGICTFIFSMVYMIFLLIRTVIYGDPVAGYPSLVIIILFLGGIQLLSLGIIGEYIGRIFNETKKRPMYFVEEYNFEKESIRDNGKSRYVKV
ncbi:glycosyltransferase [Paenibacillus sp. LMG 31458]|uniref:Glycosyltransferase n=1 Tax=Paenibacillus phytorum TaxID=2654977 RepID=A0ABX1XZ66_9BACL|nr:glycosyltransferase family 2 protein [Paenibacillus phytorum]NOU73885.1 glycosyltransferase [Paenibacillus phytorum]